MATELLSPEGLRLDGRRPKELRKLECELGALAKADGSATLSMGNTIVTASVFGPHEVTGGRNEEDLERAIIKCEASIAPFSAGERRQRGPGDRVALELASLVANAVEQTVMTELEPRSQIDVYLQVLQTDGGMRAACINAAMLALADAGIPLRDMVAACTVGWAEKTAMLDLNHTEEARGGPQLTLALHRNLDKVVVLSSEQRVAVEEVEQMQELAAQGCKAVTGYMREQLLAHVRQLATARGPADL